MMTKKTLNKYYRDEKYITDRHNLEEDGSRWYFKICNKSDEYEIFLNDDLTRTREIQNSKFPYYVTWDEDTGIEAVYPTLGELKEGEEKSPREREEKPYYHE